MSTQIYLYHPNISKVNAFSKRSEGWNFETWNWAFHHRADKDGNPNGLPPRSPCFFLGGSASLWERPGCGCCCCCCCCGCYLVTWLLGYLVTWLLGSSWFLLVPLGSSWFLLVPLGSSWFLLVHLGSSWFILVHLGSSWFILVHLGSSWFILVHLGSSWFILVHLGSSWFNLVHLGSSWFMFRRFSSHTTESRHVTDPGLDCGSMITIWVCRLSENKVPQNPIWHHHFPTRLAIVGRLTCWQGLLNRPTAWGLLVQVGEGVSGLSKWCEFLQCRDTNRELIQKAQ